MQKGDQQLHESMACAVWTPVVLIPDRVLVGGVTQLIGAKAVAETMRLNETLTELDLSNNFLREASATTIALAMKVNIGITRLDLSHNAFKDEPARTVGPSRIRYSPTCSSRSILSVLPTDCSLPMPFDTTSPWRS